MIELKGKYNSAKVFTDNIDNETVGQLITLLNQEFAKDNTINNAGYTCRKRVCYRYYYDY